MARHEWCFNCRNFKKNAHGMNVDPEIWVRQARSEMPEYGDEGCWRMRGDTVVGTCAKDSGNGVILCMATIDECPGWEDAVPQLARDNAKAVVDAYEGMGLELTLRGKTDKAVRLGDAVDDAMLAIGLKPRRAMKNDVDGARMEYR